MTGFNETMFENAFRWLDDSKTFTKCDEMKATFGSVLDKPEGRLNPEEMIDAMIKIVPSNTGKFRNIVPKFVEDMIKEHQIKASVVEI